MDYREIENMTLKETGPRKRLVIFDIHEDEIKGLLRAKLVKEGFPDASITVKLGKDHGPDIEAPFPDGEGRIFIAVKGEPAPTLQQGTKKGEKKATGRVATQRRHWLWENPRRSCPQHETRRRKRLCSCLPFDLRNIGAPVLFQDSPTKTGPTSPIHSARSDNKRS